VPIESSRLTVYLDKLRNDLKNGLYPPETRVITVNELSVQTGVSESTASKGLSTLVTEGFGVIKRGKKGGFYPNTVIPDPPINDSLIALEPFEIPIQEFVLPSSVHYQRNRTSLLENHLRRVISRFAGGRLPIQKELLRVLGGRRDTFLKVIQRLKEEDVIEIRGGDHEHPRTFVTVDSWRKRVDQRHYLAHVVTKEVLSGNRTVGSSLTVDSLVDTYGITRSAALFAYDLLKKARIIDAPKASIYGAKIAIPPYDLREVLIDEKTATVWRATRDLYELPETTGEIAERVAFDIRRRIDSGELRPGDKLPNSLTIQAIYKESSVVIRRALKLLGEENYILTSDGVDYSVHPDAKIFENLQGVSRLGKEIWHDHQGKLPAVNPEFVKSTRQKYGKKQPAIRAALRQLRHVNAWESTKISRLHARPSTKSDHLTVATAQQGTPASSSRKVR
jgi:DNA-binding GntR family transcriptional regulator